VEDTGGSARGPLDPSDFKEGDFSARYTAMPALYMPFAGFLPSHSWRRRQLSTCQLSTCQLSTCQQSTCQLSTHQLLWEGPIVSRGQRRPPPSARAGSAAALRSFLEAS